jgi:general secretion pathway protein B
MSYILDALRKADADRERDPARGIHAQPRSAVPANASSSLPAWIWPAAMVLVVLAVGVLWWPREAPVRRPPEPPAVASAQAFPAPAPATATAPAPAAMAAADSVSPPAPPPLAAPPELRSPAGAPPNPQRSGTRMPPPPPAIAGAPGVPGVPAAAAVPGPAPGNVPAPSVQASPQAVVPTSERVFGVGELPPEIQRDLPKLAISGGVHSENAAQRMLIVGGQVMSEGAEVAPGVVLEQIRPHAAVLRFRGYRYSVTF